MSATGLDVFDKTLHTTNIWLDQIMVALGPDRQLAWRVLGAVLRALRDRLPIELAVHLGSQLPILVRGIYYDQWKVSTTPEKRRTVEQFVERIREDLSGTRPVNVEDAIRVVLEVLSAHVAGGQIDKVRDALPKGLHGLLGHGRGAG